MSAKPPAKTPPARPAPTPRDQRLAQALRDNLRRRKAAGPGDRSPED